MPQQKVRRPHGRIWLRDPGDDAVEQARNQEWLDFWERQRDYGIVALDDVRRRMGRETYWEDHFYGDSLDTRWGSSTGGGGGGTVGIIDDGLGGVARLSLGLIVGSWVRMDFSNIRQLNKSMSPRLRARVKFLDIVDIKVRVGLYNQSDTQDFIWFENDPGASAVNWFGKTNSGGTGSSLDLNTSSSLTSWQLLEFIVDSATGVVAFYIDDAPKGSISTNLPTLNLQPLVYLESDSNIDAKAFTVDYFLVEANQEP